MNSYNVTFVFDYARISACVFAMHEDAAPELAVVQICNDLGLRSDLFDGAEDIAIELLDENVGMEEE